MVCRLGKPGQLGRGFTYFLRQLQSLLIIRLTAEFLDKQIGRCPVQAGKGMNFSALR
jgi:hypothetical protein